MKKVLVTILLLTLCFGANANGFIVKIVGDVFFRVGAKEFLAEESERLLREEIPVLVFSRSRAIVFPTLKNVLTEVLDRVLENKFFIGYKITEGFPEEAISKLEWVA